MSYKKIYIKVTTLPQTEDLLTDSLEFKVYKSKYEEAKEFVKDSDVLHSYLTESSKNPSFAKIYSLTIGYVNENNLRVNILKGDEKEILQTFLDTIRSSHFSQSTLVGYNLGFLFGFLTTRMLKNGLDISDVPQQINHLNKKPWEIKGSKDMFGYFKGISWFQPNMVELAFTTGLNTNLIDGSEIYNYYKSQRIGEIDNNDTLYIQNVCNLDRISEGLEKIMNVVFVKKQEDLELPNVLEVIYNNNKISKQSKDRLKELLGKKRVYKKDRPLIKEIILACYIHGNFEIMDQDSKKVIAKKEEEVNQFIESL